MRILGIDPGSNATGWGLIERREGRLVHRAHGTLRLERGAPLSERLALLHRELVAVVAQHEPDAAAVETVFVAHSVRSALVLGQARGVALAVLGGVGVEVHEYAPRAIKAAVTGSGEARKSDVQRQVRRLLALDAEPAQDAADALAAALCHGRGRALPPGWKPRAKRQRGRRSARFVLRSGTP